MASHDRINCRYPVLVLVILATAIPVELRQLGGRPIGFDVWWKDVFVNIAAYAAIGLVSGEMRAARVILLGTDQAALGFFRGLPGGGGVLEAESVAHVVWLLETEVGLRPMPRWSPP